MSAQTSGKYSKYQLPVVFCNDVELTDFCNCMNIHFFWGVLHSP